MRPRGRPSNSGQRDVGVVTAVEMMFVLGFALLALAFIGYLGRLHAAGVQVQSATQAAARAASLAVGRGAADAAVRDALGATGLATRCTGALSSTTTWTPSPSGAWQGGSVTVQVTCTLANDELTGLWAPGDRTISASDTQPIDRYQR